MSSKTKLTITTLCIFVAIIIGVYYATYLFASKAGQKTSLQPSQTAIQIQKTTQQIKKITFKNIETEETMELWADGTVNYFDKFGKLIKSARRGFAETMGKFRDLERLINTNKKIEGLDGFQIIIETEQGTIIVNPGDQGDGEEVVDDIHDYIDQTINPTPRPSAPPTPTSLPGISPYPTYSPSPNPSTSPNPTTVPPFICADYYKSGKSIKISNIICGPETTP